MASAIFFLLKAYAVALAHGIYASKKELTS